MKHGEDIKRCREYLCQSAEVKKLVAEHCLPQLVEAADLVADSLARGGKLMLCGNGGSAADAQHIAAEFVNQMYPHENRAALAAIALTTDTSSLTAIGNDRGFAQVFARQVEALGRATDVLVAISTTGDSENVIRAVEESQAVPLITIGFLGTGGGRLRALVDVAIIVPSSSTQHVQESHIAIGHMLSQLVCDRLFGSRRSD